MNTRTEADEYFPLADQYIQLIPKGSLEEIRIGCTNHIWRQRPCFCFLK
jgi:hypothetical protein